MSEKFSTPTIMLVVTAFAIVCLNQVAFARQGNKDAAVKAAPIERVLDANPEPDGKAYRIDLLLTDGTRVAYQIPPSEASKIADGLSKPAVAGGQNRQVATILSGMKVQVDSKGKALIMIPRSKSGELQSLAIPIGGANLFIKILQTKVAEAKTIAAKQRKQRK
jgi:hypothetical protein